MGSTSAQAISYSSSGEKFELLDREERVPVPKTAKTALRLRSHDNFLTRSISRNGLQSGLTRASITCAICSAGLRFGV